MQEREPLVTTAAERQDLHDEIDMTTRTFGRRKLLLGLFGGRLRQPGRRLRRSDRIARAQAAGRAGAHRRGGPAPGSSPLAGSPIALPTPTYDQLVTVFPDGHIGVDDSQVVLLRLPPEPSHPATRSTPARSTAGSPTPRSAPTPAARSGCSASTTGRRTRCVQLVCPCHQSVFDPPTAPSRVGGPATRSLPQLAARRRRRGLPRRRGAVRPTRRARSPGTKHE